MTSIRRQISISCPPSEVFAVLTDIDRLAEFSHMTVGISNSPGRTLALGDHFEQVVKVLADKVVFEKRHERDAEEILAGLKTLCEGAPARHPAA